MADLHLQGEGLALAHGADTAQDLGASTLGVVWHVILPLSLPGVAVGAFLTFVITIGDYVTPQILGGNTEVLVPQAIMLQIVRTAGARAKVRHWLRQRRQDDSQTLGQEMLERELKRMRAEPDHKALEEVARALGLPDVERLYARLGEGQRLRIEVRRFERAVRRHGSVLAHFSDLASRSFGSARTQEWIISWSGSPSSPARRSRSLEDSPLPILDYP